MQSSEGGSTRLTLTRVHIPSEVTSFIQSKKCPATRVNSWPQRYVRSQRAAVQLIIISKKQHRRPWPSRKSPQQCEASSQLLPLCRRHPKPLSSLTAASCWGEGPFWGMHMCKWTVAQTPRCRRMSTLWNNTKTIKKIVWTDCHLYLHSAFNQL